MVQLWHKRNDYTGMHATKIRVSPSLAKDWNKWTMQLQDVKVPRSLIRESTTVKAIDIHQFADASNLAFSTLAVAAIQQGTVNVKGLLASKSRIPKETERVYHSQDKTTTDSIRQCSCIQDNCRLDLEDVQK